MASLTDHLRSHLRLKPRQTRSTADLSTRASWNDHCVSDWRHVPIEFRPVHQSSGAHVGLRRDLSRPPSTVPSAPQRPRSTSPYLSLHNRDAPLSGDASDFAYRRSMHDAYDKRSRVPQDDQRRQKRRTRVEIATALPPDALDIPPAYESSSFSPPPDRPTRVTAIAASRPLAHPDQQVTTVTRTHEYRPYRPPRPDYLPYRPSGDPAEASPRPSCTDLHGTTAVHQSLEPLQPPADAPESPVSPLSGLDCELWAARPVLNGNDTIDKLLFRNILR